MLGKWLDVPLGGWMNKFRMTLPTRLAKKLMGNISRFLLNSLEGNKTD